MRCPPFLGYKNKGSIKGYRNFPTKSQNQFVDQMRVKNTAKQQNRFVLSESQRLFFKTLLHFFESSFDLDCQDIIKQSTQYQQYTQYHIFSYLFTIYVREAVFTNIVKAEVFLLSTKALKQLA